MTQAASQASPSNANARRQAARRICGDQEVGRTTSANRRRHPSNRGSSGTGWERPLRQPDGARLHRRLRQRKSAETDFRPRVFHPDDMERLRERRAAGFSGAESLGRTRCGCGEKTATIDGFSIRYNPLFDKHGRLVRWCAAGRTSKIASAAKRGCEKRIWCFGKRSTALPCSKKSLARPRHCARCLPRWRRWRRRILRF